ncbi:hypothetical protein CAPTEDRAFT_210184 [Capitella teleta]|uniref:Methyltransferase domain-containing protein n=1 Tax=Capitella teleta TaxID=283909 RepID=R7TVP8_CAPTE|nr:hypothetical protein CAPTEDRAFT_210184 [Capitella teleta]|eukprot:ELT97784.1 hypothetical protein CAPTEDRAFT_210184 [Capitella teleta]
MAQSILWMGTRIPVLIFIAVVALVVLLQHFPANYLHVSRNPQDEMTSRTEKKALKYSLTVNGTTASAENFYIIRPNYKINAEPMYYVDKGQGDLVYQLSTYYVAGELARRYNARYLIDVGCGSGVKLASFRDEFHVIGIDYEANIRNASKAFPDLQFIEANLEGDSECNVVLSPAILSQAVVVSADIIEHLKTRFLATSKSSRNSASMQQPLLSALQTRANLGRVIEMPGEMIINDNYNGKYKYIQKEWETRLHVLYIYSRGYNGPPANLAHVREWLNTELELLFLDSGLYPLYSGLSCGHMGLCGDGFLPYNTKQTNQIQIMGNEQVRESWLVVDHGTSHVVAFIVHERTTAVELLMFNVDYLIDQGIEVNVVSIGASVPPMSRTKFHTTQNRREAFDVIIKLCDGNTYQTGDWFIILDSNDVITFNQSDALQLNLKETLQRIGSEPYGFNAVAMTIFFMQSPDGRDWTPDMPFKIFAQGVWHAAARADDRLRPAVDTLKNRVRIWKKSSEPLEIALSKTESGSEIITDVGFIGRRVYPYHALDLRFHPKFKKPYSKLAYDLRRMYVLDIALNYQPKALYFAIPMFSVHWIQPLKFCQHFVALHRWTAGKTRFTFTPTPLISQGSLKVDV